MTGSFHRATRWQALGVLLLALVIGVRGMVPSGYMLDRADADGSVIIRLCGGVNDRFMAFNPETGAMEETGDPDKAPADPQDQDAKSTCPFALTATFDVPKDDAVLQLAFFGPPLLSAVPVIATPDSRAARPPLPARGPPVRV